VNDAPTFRTGFCDNCAQKLEFPAEGVGMEIECPTCHKMTRLISDPKYQPKMNFGPLGDGMRIRDEALSAIPPDGESYYRVITEMPGKPAALRCACQHCKTELSYSPVGHGRQAKCPACGGLTVLFDREFTRLLADHIQGIVKRAEAEYQESMRKVTCPNCGTPYAYDVCQPSKPLVFTPLSFTGILMGGIANAMADRIFPEVNVCRRCGHRWPAEY